MGVYFSQALTIFGPPGDLRKLLDEFFEVDEDGVPFDVSRSARVEQFLASEGIDHSLSGFKTDSFDEGAVTVRFSTKGLTISPLVKVMGERFPSLNLRLAAMDDGEYPFVSSSQGGAFSENQVEATVEFVTEVEGQPREVSDLYTEPAVVRPWPTTHFRFWFAERQVLRSLPGYPVYQPPFVGLPSTLSRDQAKENFEHFMGTRAARLENLRAFLHRFNVDLAPADASLRNLDRWLAKFGAFLAVREHGSSFTTYLPPWDGPRLGQNVIFDLATYLGEAAIFRMPGFHWELYEDVPPGLRQGDAFYQTFVVRGPNPNLRWRIWPFSRIHSVCEALRERSFMWRKPRVNISPRDAVENFFSYELGQETKRALQLDNTTGSASRG
jgi:hypothetical protein